MLAFGGAAAGVAAAAMGSLVWWRRRQAEADPFGEESGRGLPETPPSPQAVERGFETEDMSGGLMAWLSLGLAVAIGLSILAMILMLHAFNHSREEAPRLTAQQQTQIATPLPHLQAAPYSEIAALRRHENERLSQYGWVDPLHARARIPIDQALARMVGQNLDAAP